MPFPKTIGDFERQYSLSIVIDADHVSTIIQRLRSIADDLERASSKQPTFNLELQDTFSEVTAALFTKTEQSTERLMTYGDVMLKAIKNKVDGFTTDMDVK